MDAMNGNPSEVSFDQAAGLRPCVPGAVAVDVDATQAAIEAA